MNPQQAIYEVFLHAFGDTALIFALEAGRAALWVWIAYFAAKRFVKHNKS